MLDARFAQAQRATAAVVGEERRITGLDGLRGVASLMVVISHFFGEVPHGIRVAMVGWVGVHIFFVLSGFLIGKLILEKSRHANFFSVFYARRFFRIIPAYILTVVLVQAFLEFIPVTWADAPIRFPTWSYLTFLQGVFMTTANSIGPHWLAPTWTLAVEEHFYLLAPAAIIVTPRSALVRVLSVTVVAAVVFRAAVEYGGLGNEMLSLSMLPGSADLLAVGVLGAVLVTTDKPIPWKWIEPKLPWALTIALVLIMICKVIDMRLFEVLAKSLSAIGCLGLILTIVRGISFARRCQSKALRFFGDNAYCTYLTHLPVLGLMHGLILRSTPDVETPAQWAVTLAALPVSILVGWAMTKLIEEPLTRYGRSWRWGGISRQPVAIAAE